MRRSLKIVLFAISVVCLAGCTRTAGKQMHSTGNRYAQGFSLCEKEGYTEAVIYNPWQDSCVMQRFYLLRDTDVVTPADGVRLHIPLQSVATTSCTHIGFLSAINSLPTIKGVASPQLVYTTLPDSNKIDIGDAMQPQLERIMLVHPEVVFLTAYQDQNKLESTLLGHRIVPVYINEWTEQDPLARAEWVRFFGVLFGKEALSDSLFSKIEEEYNSLTRYAKDELPAGVSILTGNNFRGTWYMPTGSTYMGRLFADAGADYYFKDEAENKSLPLSEEEVLLHFQKAEVWVGSNARTLEELAQMDSKHTLFRAYQTGRVFNFYKRTTPSGGNDFWEMGIVHPEYILHDLILMCHPSAYKDIDSELIFSEQLR